MAPIRIDGLPAELLEIAHRHRILTYGGYNGALMADG
jgi:hypothetical protein